MSTAFSDQLKGNWNLEKGQLKQKWGNLTDDDLTYERGKEDELVGRIQERTGATKQAINEYLDNLKF